MTFLEYCWHYSNGYNSRVLCQNKNFQQKAISRTSASFVEEKAEETENAAIKWESLRNKQSHCLLMHKCIKIDRRMEEHKF